MPEMRALLHESAANFSYDRGLLSRHLRTAPASAARWPIKRAAAERHKRKDSNLFPGHSGRMLDFGCGAGRFLQRMHRRGWMVLGLDPSAGAVEFIRGQLHLPALLGTLPHPELRPGSFELITMWHALEHVHAPLQILREAYRLLVPGGKLHVAVPNIDSLPFRWFGSTWYGLDGRRATSRTLPPGRCI